MVASINSEEYILREIDEKSFQDILDLDNPNYIVVNSYGGREHYAIKIANFIYENEINIIIDGVCTSACASYILPAAKSVFVKENSLITMHQTTYGINQLRGFDIESLENKVSFELDLKESLKFFEKIEKNIDYLIDSTFAVGPYCINYNERKLYPEYNFWVPPGAYFVSHGIDINGYYPSSVDELENLVNHYFIDNVNFIYGGGPKDINEFTKKSNIKECS